MKVDGWRFERDGADWRGYSLDGWKRTRLKWTREWAMKDAEAGRVQVKQGDVWVDEIDGRQRGRYTMPVVQ